MSNCSSDAIAERHRIETIAVFDRRTSDKENVLARVQFAYTHSGFDPLRVGREYEDSEKQGWRFFEVASVPSGSRVAIRDAKLVSGPTGVFLSGPWKGIPREVLDYVCEVCLRIIEERK